MRPYTYRIKFTKTNEYYYGVRHSKNCDPSDLWVTYFTSSKTVKDLIKMHGKENFVTEIRKIFNTPAEAINWEGRVNKFTKQWPNYLNKSDVKSIGNEFGRKGGQIGGANCKRDKKGIHSDEQMLKKSEYASLGGKASVEQQVGLHTKKKHWITDPSTELKRAQKAAGKKTGSMPWWNNGIKDTKSNTRPGPDWVPGMLTKGHYWNNGLVQQVCNESPGEGWVRGGLNKTVNGKKWWNNGTIQKMALDRPNTEWCPGRLPGSSAWWNNGVIQCRQKKSPGPGWVPGML